MKKNKINKYNIKETCSLYIQVCKEMNQNKEEITIRNIVEKIALEINSKKNIEIIKSDVLDKIQFKWELSVYEIIAYAIAIFYVLANRDETLTEENIVNELLNELYIHKPQRTIKEAEFIAERIFPELLTEEF